MRYIYSWATRVILWTGEEDSFTVRAFEIIDKFGSSLSRWFDTSNRDCRSGSKWRDEFFKLSALLLEHSDRKFIPLPDSTAANKSLRLPPETKWEALPHFYGRPVFERIWIIREMCVVARVTVVCGSYQIDWSKVANAAIILDDKKNGSRLRLKLAFWTRSGRMVTC